jgi:hypothetical protein
MLPRATTESEDAKIEVEIVAERDGDSVPLHELVPGDAIRVDLRVTFQRPAQQATIGCSIWDPRRAMYVYEASSELNGVPPIRANAGETRSFSLRLKSHLTRGLYQIHLNIYDLVPQRYLVAARAVASISVAERESQNGVANLYLEVTEVGSARERVDRLEPTSRAGV